jgi:hypothetical protein
MQSCQIASADFSFGHWECPLVAVQVKGGGILNVIVNLESGRSAGQAVTK